MAASGAKRSFARPMFHNLNQRTSAVGGC
jgi:hypothetical protein